MAVWCWTVWSAHGGLTVSACTSPTSNACNISPPTTTLHGLGPVKGKAVSGHPAGAMICPYGLHSDKRSFWLNLKGDREAVSEGALLRWQSNSRPGTQPCRLLARPRPPTRAPWGTTSYGCTAPGYGEIDGESVSGTAYCESLRPSTVAALVLGGSPF